MSTAETARTVVGIIGNIISLCLFLSPLPTFVKIVKRRTVGQFSPTPYLATLMNCALWVFYGMPFVKPHSTLVLTINGTGVFLESIYLALFFFFAPREMRVFIIGIILGEAAFVGAVTAGVLAGVHAHDKRRQIVGILCVIFGTGMYAAPLVVMRTVVKSRSVQFMPFWLSLASFLNGVCWTTYAVIKFDIFITIPNALGTMLAILQLVLYFMYYRTDPIRQVEMQEQEPAASGNGSLNGIAINIR